MSDDDDLSDNDDGLPAYDDSHPAAFDYQGDDLDADQPTPWTGENDDLDDNADAPPATDAAAYGDAVPGTSLDDPQLADDLSQVRFGAVVGQTDTGDPVEWSNSFNQYYNTRTWEEVEPK